MSNVYTLTTLITKKSNEIKSKLTNLNNNLDSSEGLNIIKANQILENKDHPLYQDFIDLNNLKNELSIYLEECTDDSISKTIASAYLDLFKKSSINEIINSEIINKLMNELDIYKTEVKKLDEEKQQKLEHLVKKYSTERSTKANFNVNKNKKKYVKQLEKVLNEI